MSLSEQLAEYSKDEVGIDLVAHLSSGAHIRMLLKGASNPDPRVLPVEFVGKVEAIVSMSLSRSDDATDPSRFTLGSWNLPRSAEVNDIVSNLDERAPRRMRLQTSAFEI